MKRLALFDVDRTLVEGSIGVAFTKFLVNKKIFPKKYYSDIEGAISLNKLGKMSFQKRGKMIIENWARGFKGQKKSDILKQAQIFFNKEKNRIVYSGAKELIEYLKKKNYYVIAISRTFEESLLPLQKYLGIQELAGTKFECNEDGKYTGRLANKMWEESAKKRELMEILKHTNLIFENSLAFGDTEDDYYMLNFAKYPITVNANRTLEKIAIKRNWPIYRDLKLLSRDLKSGKLMPQTDWLHHYLRKYGFVFMNDETAQFSSTNDKPFVDVVKKFIKPDGKILEVGCGLGRTAINLSLAGFHVTAIDSDSDILDVARINCINFGRNIKLKLMNLFDIDRYFKSKSFDVVTHGGVLEHFSDNQIKIALDKELIVAKRVIFSVPVRSKRNEGYFKRDIMGHRHLLTENEWRNFLKDYYLIKYSKVNRSLRKDDLIVVLESRRSR